MNKKFEIDTMKNVGPDFYIGRWGNRDHYIECIAPGQGDEDSPDRLPDFFDPLKKTIKKSLASDARRNFKKSVEKLSHHSLSKIVTIKSLSEDQYLLRLKSALDKKLQKYNKYIRNSKDDESEYLINRKGKVDESDCLIIAISSIDLGQQGNLMNFPHSAIEKILFGTHHAIIDAKTRGIIGYTKRDTIIRSNGKTEKIGLFNEDKYKVISGVIYSNIDLMDLKHPQHPERTFEFIRNPNACNRISDEFFNKLTSIEP